MSNVGYATLSVIPSLKGLDKSVSGQLEGPLKTASTQAGIRSSAAFGGTFSKGVGAAGGKASKSLTSSLGGGLSRLEHQLGSFGLPFTEVLGSMGSKLDSAGGKVDGFAGHLQQVGGVIATTAGAGLAAFGAIAVKEALDGEGAHARLETAIKNAGEEYGVYSHQIEGATGKLAKYGFTAPEVADSIASLTAVTHDAGTATGLEGEAADVARGRHIDLASATSLLVKVESGHVALLGKYGIATKDANGQTISSTVALAKLAQLYGGDAAANAQTFQGKLAALEATGKNFAETTGEKIIPVIESFVSGGLGLVHMLTSVNSATDGWAGKVVIAGAGVAVTAFAVGKLVVGFQLLEAKLVQVAAQFIVVDAEGVVAASTLGLVAGVLTGVGIVAIAAVGSLKLLSSIEPNLGGYKKLDDEFKSLDQTLITTGELSGENARKINADAGVSANALDVYRNALLNGATQQQAFAMAQRANINNGPAYTAELHTWTADVDKYVQSLTPTQKASALLSAAQKQLTNDMALGHTPLSIIALDEKKIEAARRGVTEVTKADTVASNKHGVATAAQVAETKAYGKAIGDLTTLAGPAFKNIAAALHLTTAQVTADTTAIKGWNDSIDQAFSGAATATIDKWSSSARFDLKKFESDLLANTIASANWATNLSKASALGLNKGFLQQLRDAGPKSAPLLQHILDTASKGSISSINTITTFGQKSAAAAKRSIDANVLGIQGTWAQLQTWVHSHPVDLTVTVNGTKIPVNAQGDLLGNIRVNGAPALSGRRASGGPVTTGGSYLVGENGPEIFTPTVNGKIIASATASRAPTSSTGAAIVIENLYARDDQDVVRVAAREQRRAVMLAPRFR